MKSDDFSNEIGIINDGRKRQSLWRTMVQVYNEFSLQSTIHGIKYTTQAKTTIGRCLWLIIVALAVVGASQLAHKFYERHESANMRTLVINNQFPILKLELPAITLCHSDVVTMHRLTAYLAKKDLQMPFGTTMEQFRDSLRYLSIILFPSSLFEKELQALERVLVHNKISLAELFDKVGPRCSDFIIMCQFEGNIQNCGTTLKQSYAPYGLCCSLNYDYVPNGSSVNISTTASYSVNFGGHFILSILTKSFGSKDRISAMMYGDGIKVMIHDRNTYPGPTSLELVAETGYETVARLYGQSLTASDDILSLSAKDRDCKRRYSHTGFYRADNCYVRCREKTIFRLCGCLPFFSSTIENGQAICNISDIPCLSRVKRKAYSLTLRDPICGCLPDCQGTSYSLITTSLPFNAFQFNPSPFYKKAREIVNASAIHITYSEQTAVLQRRELVLSWINLVSSLGGVFSLCLGCSFISIIEIIYFFLIIFVWKLRKALRTRRPIFGSA